MPLQKPFVQEDNVFLEVIYYEDGENDDRPAGDYQFVV